MGTDQPSPFRHRDLDDAEELAELVCRFYREVAQDDVLGPIFEAMEVDWAEHVPKLARYWERMLLGRPGYAGHPMEAHARVATRSPFQPEQFDRWIELFGEAVDSGWSGPVAQVAKRRAVAVAAAIARQVTAGEPWRPSAADGVALDAGVDQLGTPSGAVRLTRSRQ